jgi:hypothetical protein
MALAAFLFCLLEGGCSGGKGKITGTVKVNGTPVEGAKVEFRPSDKKLGRSITYAYTGPDGKFELLPPRGASEALKPGKYVVLITKWVDKKTGKVPSEEERGQLEARLGPQPEGSMLRKYRNDIPREYSDEAFPKITVEIKAGSNEPFAWDLKGK